MAGTAAGPEQSSTPFSDSEDRPCSNGFYHVLCINQIKSSPYKSCKSPVVPHEQREKQSQRANSFWTAKRGKETFYIYPAIFLMFIVAEFGETMEKEHH